ncbi:MAG TPA: aspartyl protease family protein [Opitutaceae bacterium]|jgi:hypothetical protein|nr:aspartyl protease family protein [Opitutaceae bacterium]
MNLSRAIGGAALALLFGLPALRVRAAESAYFTEFSADRIVLPTTVEPLGYLDVDVRINGAGPFRLQVDTGSSTLLLPGRVAAAAGLKPREERVPFSTAGGGHDLARVARVDRLESAGFAVGGFDAAILAVDEVPNWRDLLHIDGILGMAAFQRAVLEMDFPLQRVLVARPGTQPYPVSSSMAFNPSGLRPVVALMIAGQPQAALIDTGSNVPLIVRDLLQFPLLNPAVGDDGLTEYGILPGQARRGFSGQLAGEVRFGPIALENPPLRDQAYDEPANIGATALQQWDVVFDSTQRRVYFLGKDKKRVWEPVPVPDRTYRPGFCGVPGSGGVRVLQVDAGGAFARAGVRVGDILLAIDGQPAAQALSTRGWGSYRRRTLHLARGGAEFDAVVAFAPQ